MLHFVPVVRFCSVLGTKQKSCDAMIVSDAGVGFFLTTQFVWARK
jgi:hypothetical protein